MLRGAPFIFKEMRFTNKHVIHSEDQVGDKIYLIKSGTVSLTKKLTRLDEIEQKKRVATNLIDLVEGKIFGGEFLLTKPLRFNAVVTSKTCDVFCVSYKDFFFEYKRCIKSITELFKYRN